MATRDEISSTEKLLELIKRDSDTTAAPSSVPPAPPSKVSRRSRFRLLPAKQRLTVGLEIGDLDLKLVKIQSAGDQKWSLVDYRSVPLEPGTPRESPQFAAFLKQTLGEFCGPAGKVALWAAMPSALAEIRQIRIPKVPKKQVATAVYWTFKKEVPFDEDANLLDFEVLEDVSEAGVQKTAINVYTAPRQEIDDLRTLLARAGYTPAGLSLPPFGIQNLFRTRWIDPGEETAGVIYVGQDWSRIDIFSSANLVLTRGVRTGMNSMLETLLAGFSQRRGISSAPTGDASPPADRGRAMDAGSRDDLALARNALYSLSRTPSASRDRAASEFGAEDIFKMVLPALERLLWQIERSFEHYSLNRDNERVRKVYVAGEIAAFERLVAFLSQQLGVVCEILNPLAADCPGLPDAEQSQPAAAGTGFSTALGMALSHPSRTPNLIFAHTQKEEKGSVVRLNRLIFAAFLPLMALAVGFFFWQSQLIRQQEARAAALQEELDRYTPQVDPGLLFQLAGRIKQEKAALKDYGRRYLALAVITELCELTPERIRLLDLATALGPVAPDKAPPPPAEATGGDSGAGAAKAPKNPKSLLLEGVVFGERDTLEAALGTYLVSLENSPLFQDPTVETKNFQPVDGKRALRFSVRVTLL